MVHCFVKNTIFHAADQLSKNLFPPLGQKIKDLKKNASQERGKKNFLKIFFFIFVVF